MADLPPNVQPPPFPESDDELVAIPRLSERTGVSPRVLRYWEELGLISPTREHGKLRYSPRDTAVARLTKRLIDAGVSLDGLQMLKDLSERELRRAGRDADELALSELALRILYQRKVFREVAGMDEEHYPEGHAGPPPKGNEAPGPAKHGPGPKGHRPHVPGTKGGGPKHKPTPQNR
jgi:DNA-binding transcriptional MerR regulator